MFGWKSQVPGTLQQDPHQASRLKGSAPRIHFDAGRIILYIHLADLMSRFDLLFYSCLVALVALSAATVWAALFAGRDDNDRDDSET
jgi:hypothetical protein